jgi:hypothetical protein
MNESPLLQNSAQVSRRRLLRLSAAKNNCEKKEVGSSPEFPLRSMALWANKKQIFLGG